MFNDNEIWRVLVSLSEQVPAVNSIAPTSERRSGGESAVIWFRGPMCECPAPDRSCPRPYSTDGRMTVRGIATRQLPHGPLSDSYSIYLEKNVFRHLLHLYLCYVSYLCGFLSRLDIIPLNLSGKHLRRCIKLNPNSVLFLSSKSTIVC